MKRFVIVYLLFLGVVGAKKFVNRTGTLKIEGIERGELTDLYSLYGRAHVGNPWERLMGIDVRPLEDGAIKRVVFSPSDIAVVFNTHEACLLTRNEEGWRSIFFKYVVPPNSIAFNQDGTRMAVVFSLTKTIISYRKDGFNWLVDQVEWQGDKEGHYPVMCSFDGDLLPEPWVSDPTGDT